MMLEYLYTSLGYDYKSSAENSLTGGWRDYGTLEPWDQTPFYEGVDWDSKPLDGRENGQIFVPTTCKDKTVSNCKIHFVLHGCNGRPGNFDNYNTVAALNDIIMIWPDT